MYRTPFRSLAASRPGPQPAVPYSSISRTPHNFRYLRSRKFFRSSNTLPPSKYIFFTSRMASPLLNSLPEWRPPSPPISSAVSFLMKFLKKNDVIWIFGLFLGIFKGFLSSVFRWFFGFFRQPENGSLKSALLAAAGGRIFLGKKSHFSAISRNPSTPPRTSPEIRPPFAVDIPKCHFHPQFSTSHIVSHGLNMGRYGTK